MPRVDHIGLIERDWAAGHEDFPGKFSLIALITIVVLTKMDMAPHLRGGAAATYGPIGFFGNHPSVAALREGHRKKRGASRQTT
jgi:hypothetical protein